MDQRQTQQILEEKITAVMDNFMQSFANIKSDVIQLLQASVSWKSVALLRGP